MSCCTIKKETNSSIKELNILKKHFDEVIIEDLEDYRLLTLRNMANKPNYDYIVWLQVKVAYGRRDGHRQWTNDEMLTGICKSISDWVDVLINFDKSNEGKQLSLFNDNSEDELEPMPPEPSSDGNWSSYHEKSNEVKKRNLMKKYSFFELCDFTYSWNSYHEYDYKHLLPQSNKEMIKLVKEAIVKGTSSEKGYGRFDDFWWDDEYNYICRDGALSDIELINRVLSLIRLYLVPYTQELHVSTDLSYSSWEIEKHIDYQYWFDGKNINSCSWIDTSDTLTYDLFDLEFIDWLRNYFDVEHKDVISDDDILRGNIEKYLQRLIGSENYENYDFKKKINTLKDWKQFKANITNLIPIGNNGGGSGYSIDGFRGSFSIDKKGNINVTHNYNQRVELNRSVDGLIADKYKEEHVVVFDISGDEIYKKAFELFNKKVVKQISLFDFLAA